VAERLRGPRAQAAKVQSLAAQAGLDPEELAGRIPADTLRRLKYPMIERPGGPGMTEFVHDRGIIEGERPLFAKEVI